MDTYIAIKKNSSLLIILFLVFQSSFLLAETRVYYIAAEDVLWDYLPSFPSNLISGLELTEAQKVFVEGNAKNRIGRKYWKGRYVGYTDASFTTVIRRDDQAEYLGILGPLIIANVGDTIVINFKNKTANKNVSMHPHGVFYTKANEGVKYKDGTSGIDKKDDSIPPDGIYTYTWEVPERAGPGSSEKDSIVWMYHSHVNETADTNAGFVGPIIISRANARNAVNRLSDIEREFVVLFTVFDENASLYFAENIVQFAPKAKVEDDDFKESNLMHSMNGYLFGNINGLTMKKNDRVRWYQIALGTEVDLHTPHWHGTTLETNNGERVDVVNLLPATRITLDMVADNPGTWMYHCHVNDHLRAGMMATYMISE